MDFPTASAPCTNVTYAQDGLAEEPRKSHAGAHGARASVARLLETEIVDLDGGTLVFKSAGGGGFLTLGQARYAFTKVTAAADGCGGVRLHDLRHTCASLRSVRGPT
jgi:integrase